MSYYFLTLIHYISFLAPSMSEGMGSFFNSLFNLGFSIFHFLKIKTKPIVILFIYYLRHDGDTNATNLWLKG